MSNNDIPNQLVSALESGHLQDISRLLSKETHLDLNKTYLITQTPLLSAISKGRLDIVNLLLEKGADPNLPNMLGQTPLFIAVSDGHMEIVQALVARGANPSHHTRQGNTPIYIAAVECHYKMLLLFLAVEEKKLSSKHPFFLIIQCLDNEVRQLLNTASEDNNKQAENKRHEKIEFLIQFRGIFLSGKKSRDELIRAAGALERKYDTRIFHEKSRAHTLFLIIMRRITLGKKSELHDPILI